MSAFVLFLVLSAAVCHAAWNVLAHGVSRIGIPFLWWGALASTMIWAPLIPLTGGLGDGGPEIVEGFALGVGVSGVLHVAYMLVLQQGYARGQLSTVYATARGTGPALSSFLAVVLLGEHISLVAGIGIAVVVFGVVITGLIGRTKPMPGVRRGLDLSIVFGVLTGVAIATYTIWDTHALRTWGLSPVAFMVGCTLVELVLYAPWMLRRRHEMLAACRAHWPRILAFGVLSPLSYLLILTAVTLAPVALVAPIREVSVVLVSLFGVLVLREDSAVRRIGASVLVVGGVLMLAF